MKNYLFILTKPAHSGAYTQEILDIILTTAAFDQPVTILWLDDAIFQLKQHQQPEKHSKDIAAILQSLELYDITELYIETESLIERGLTQQQLNLPIKLISRNTISEFINQYSVIFTS